MTERVAKYVVLQFGRRQVSLGLRCWADEGGRSKDARYSPRRPLGCTPAYPEYDWLSYCDFGMPQPGRSEQEKGSNGIGSAKKRLRPRGLTSNGMCFYQCVIYSARDASFTPTAAVRVSGWYSPPYWTIFILLILDRRSVGA